MEKQIQKPLGVIDALYNGFELVFARPWILLIPIALDVALWFAPQITAEPVLQRFIAMVSAAQPPNATPEMIQSFNDAQKIWLAAGARFNVFSVIALVALGMPTLAGLDFSSATFLRSRFASIPIADSGMFLQLVGLMTVIGILLGSVYLETIARVVRRETNGVGVFLRRSVRQWLTVGWLMLLTSVIAFIALVPFGLGAAVLGLFDQSIGAFLFLLGLMLVMWGALYLTFAVPAIFVSGAGVRQSVTLSLTIFRYNFWSAMGLLGLIMIIEAGFQTLWQWIIGAMWGVIAADVANAFLGSALIAALMLFYQDRITFWMRVREQFQQQQQQKPG